MIVSFSLPPIGTLNLATIAPVTSRLFDAITPATAAPTFNGGSSVVQLSSSGSLLSAISSFQSELQILQNTSTDTTSGGVFTQAQDFVDAFNSLQDSIASLQPLFDSLSGTSLVDGFAQTLNELATTTVATGSASLGNLGSIGIELQAASPPSAGVTLGIDQNVLASAVATNPAGTSAILDQAIQSFSDQTAGFESQVVDVLVAQANLAVSAATTTAPVDLTSLAVPGTTTLAEGIDTGTDLLQNLAAATVPNYSSVTNLDLAAARNVTNLLTENERVTPTAPTPIDDSSATLAEIAPTPTTGTTIPAGTENPATAGPSAEASAANYNASAATLALQALLNNPSARALSIAVDPAYAAVVAASRLSDFILPTPTINPRGLPDAVQPVAAIMATTRIGSYVEAAGVEIRQRVNTLA